MNDEANASTSVTERNPPTNQLSADPVNDEGESNRSDGADQKIEAHSLSNDEGSVTNVDDVVHTPANAVESEPNVTVREAVSADVDPGESSELNRVIDNVEMVRVGGESVDSQASDLSLTQGDAELLIEGMTFLI
ncbi:hypothetical protein M9458_051868 [Cirrhinus mrigala]|uniref:Uncharacterized protein n=1 Tax=Cirrhinus mrigala TaxID=683832 RepID=A0ABD0MS08_CIRMR